MTSFGRAVAVVLGAGILGLSFAGAASAQENLDHGKTAAQLYASDCAVCHKSPQGLAKGGGVFGTESFLREHYTASRESAAAISKYLESFGNARGPTTAPGKKAGGTKRTTKGDEKKGEEKRGSDKKGGDKSDGAVSLPGDNKPADAKPAEPKASESKPVESKPAESKPAEPKTEAAPKSE
jgi:hypothetical protein